MISWHSFDMTAEVQYSCKLPGDDTAIASTAGSMWHMNPGGCNSVMLESTQHLQQHCQQLAQACMDNQKQSACCSGCWIFYALQL
jgi:hypothetical protein